MYQLLIYYFHKYRHTHFFSEKLTRAQGNLIQVRYTYGTVPTEKNASTMYIKKKLKKKSFRKKTTLVIARCGAILRMDKKN